MAYNFLEELAVEWYDLQGYFVRRNVLVGLRKAGGYEGELDVVAFNPVTRHLVHVEATHDAHSWSTRDARFSKKFGAGRKWIPKLFPGVDLPTEIDQVCLLGFGSNKNRKMVGGGRIVTVAEFLETILREVIVLTRKNTSVPEGHPLLRTLQFIAMDRKRFAALLADR